jgi:hypothetical protein
MKREPNGRTPLKHRLIPRASGIVLVTVAMTVAGAARADVGQRYVQVDLYPGGLKSMNNLVDCSSSSSSAYCDSGNNFLNFTTEGSFGPTGWGAVSFPPNGINGTQHLLSGHDISWCYVVVECADGSEYDDQEMGTLLNGVGAPLGNGASNDPTDCFASCPRGVPSTGVYSQVAIVRSQ